MSPFPTHQATRLSYFGPAGHLRTNSLFRGQTSICILVIAADTIDGKRLGRDHPFCFILRNNRGDLVVARKLAYIRLAATPYTIWVTG